MERRTYDYKTIAKQNAERGKLALFFRRLGYRFSKINMFSVAITCSVTLALIPALKDFYYRMTMDPVSYNIQRKQQETMMRNMVKFGEGIIVPFYGKINLLDPVETARLKEVDEVTQNELLFRDDDN